MKSLISGSSLLSSTSAAPMTMLYKDKMDKEC